MLTDSQIKSLNADHDGLVLELRPSKKKLNKVFTLCTERVNRPYFLAPALRSDLLEQSIYIL